METTTPIPPEPDAAQNDFAPVAEAARRIGISERQARRRAQRLADADRKETPAGLRVRVDALAAVAPEPAPDGRTDGHATGHRTDGRPDAGRTSDGRTDGHAPPPDTSAALIGQLQSEVAYLRGALEREQDTARAALAELAAERQRAGVLIAAAATGRLVIPEATDGRTDARPDAGPDMTGHHDRTPDGRTPAPPDAEAPPPRRHWWQFGRKTP